MKSLLKSRAVLITLAVLLALGLVKGCQIRSAMQAGAQHQMPPQAVTSYVVKPQTWEQISSAVASLSPVQGAMLSAEESGKVVKVNFDSGAPVNAGDVLVQLDTSVEEAQLHSAEARVQLAQVSLRRTRTLRPSNATSQADLDTAEAQAKQAEADANAVRAQIGRKTITAPFAGQAGIRSVNVGDFVMQGKEIVPVQALGTIYANFTLPQQALAVIHTGQVARLTLDAVPGETFTGSVNAMDPQVNETTRNFRVQAIFSNPNFALRPGMFGNISIITDKGETSQVLAIPLAAISYAPYGNSVFVISKLDDGKGGTYDGVEQRIVQLGASRGDMAVVLSGLKDGEKIVSSGAFKLMPKMAVMENNSVSPGTSVAPQVVDN